MTTSLLDQFLSNKKDMVLGIEVAGGANDMTEKLEGCGDENQSGTKASRPGLDRMMKAVENGEIETVVVFAFSRYARSVSHR